MVHPHRVRGITRYITGLRDYPDTTSFAKSMDGGFEIVNVDQSLYIHILLLLLSLWSMSVHTGVAMIQFIAAVPLSAWNGRIDTTRVTRRWRFFSHEIGKCIATSIVVSALTGVGHAGMIPAFHSNSFQS